ncbi:DUF2254 domain-containing protein [Actinomyces vulturis]|uniref:DUF2254 domain-containing protein n=1 Tax=Actinomyces vulturis TaxID=1857645 RepID=UPI00159EDE1C|nr:DUF2254 domain-containing protein [Actinomyces vulturis]
MKNAWASFINSAQSKLWVLPMVSGIIGAILALIATEITIPEQYFFARFLWPGDAKAASDMLSFIASTTMTVLTTTISMTLIVLQVASGNFSHQLLRDYIQSKAVRVIIAVYVGVFTYTVLVLRSMEDDAIVPPQLAMTMSMIMIFIAVATFIWYVSRVVDMVRVDTIISTSVDRTVKYAAIATDDDTPAPSECPEIPDTAFHVFATDSGYVQRVDLDGAARWAKNHNATVIVQVRPGDRVMEGRTLLRWWMNEETHCVADAPVNEQAPEHGVVAGRDQGEDSAPTPPTIVNLDHERSSGQDFSLGLRQLSDIAVRALSPGTNDPTTARHVIAQAATALRTLVANPPQPHARFLEEDDADQPRLVVWAPSRGAAELVDSFIGEIRRYAESEPGILIDLLTVLSWLDHSTTDPWVHDVVDAQRHSIVAAANRGISDDRDRERVIEAAEGRTSHGAWDYGM